MNRGELVDEFASRGFDYLDTAQQQTFIDRAVQELTIEELWSFRRTEVSYTHGEEILEAGTVKQVFRSGYGPLEPTSLDELRDNGLLVTDQGLATHYYLGGRVLKTYPQTTEDLTVDVFSRYGWTTGLLVASGDADTPRMPAEMQPAILDFAERIAHEENKDYDEAAAGQTIIDRRLEQFRANHLDPHEDEMKFVRQTEYY